MKIQNLLIITFLSLSLLLVSCSGQSAVVSDDTPEEYAAKVAFAECLTESGAKFYGAYWCPHCQDQKEMFGEAVEFAPYVECTEETDACNAAGITGYPTWIFGDGTVLQGAQNFDVLSDYSGCEYLETSRTY